MNSVVHFEVPFDNKERATLFYSEIFGWKINDMPEIDYTGVMTTATGENMMPTTPGAINGALVQRTATESAPVITIGVDSIDAFLPRIEANGGKIVVAKGEVPDMGYYAYFTDTEGNVIGLWQNWSSN